MRQRSVAASKVEDLARDRRRAARVVHRPDGCHSGSHPQLFLQLQYPTPPLKVDRVALRKLAQPWPGDLS